MKKKQFSRFYDMETRWYDEDMLGHINHGTAVAYFEDARVRLSTIHAAKGGEATNVVLLTDLTENTMRSYEKNPDDENRLFYVGATRTKENLHIIEPKKYEKGYLL